MMSTCGRLKTKDKRSTGEEKETMPKSPTPSGSSDSIEVEESFFRKSTDSANSPNKARVSNDGNESMLSVNSSKSSNSKSAKSKKGGRGRSVKSSNEFVMDGRKGKSKSKTKKKKAWETTTSSEESDDFIVPLPVEYQAEPSEDIFYVEDIRDKRIVNKRRKGSKGKPTLVLEYLVKWQGYPESENTWEPQEGLQCFDIIDAFERRYAVSAERRNRERSPSSSSSSSDESIQPLRVLNQEVTTPENPTVITATVLDSGNAFETNDCETKIFDEVKPSESNDIKAGNPDGCSSDMGSMKIRSRRSSAASEISVSETIKLYNSETEGDVMEQSMPSNLLFSENEVVDAIHEVQVHQSDEQTGRIAVDENKVVEVASTKSTEVENGQTVLAKEADSIIFPICGGGEAEFPRSNWEEHGFRNPKIICTCINDVTKTFKFLVHFEGMVEAILVDKDLCNEVIPLEVIRFYESYLHWPGMVYCNSRR